jgi:methionine-rich copper-binding protein CopC
MMARYFRTIALSVLCFVGVDSAAQAAELGGTRPMVMESVTIGERSTEVFVRFDRPISHVRSSIAVIRDGKAVAILHARLDAAPNVLFARIPTLPPGDYIARWTVCPAGSSDRHDGEFAFTVGPNTASMGERRR